MGAGRGWIQQTGLFRCIEKLIHEVGQIQHAFEFAQRLHPWDSQLSPQCMQDVIGDFGEAGQRLQRRHAPDREPQVNQVPLPKRGQLPLRHNSRIKLFEMC